MMRKTYKITTILTAAGFAWVLLLTAAAPVRVSGAQGAALETESTESEDMVKDNRLEGLVLQNLDYTEDPADIPNPDRGFYRANDGMVVPVTGEGEEETRMNVGEEPVTVGGAQVITRVSHVYFDLRNFSDNAITECGVPYDEDYFAPEDVSIRSREGDQPPYDYDTHLDYWLDHEFSKWPRGTSQPLTQDALAFIRDKLEQVRNGEGVTMVRFNYDGSGFSWVSAEHPDDGDVDQKIADVEPDKEMLLEHISQIAPVLEEYEDILMGVDGGFFGPWGEMHSSTFGTSPEAYKWLLDALLEAVPESRSITVHAGAFLSWYNATYGTDYTFGTIDQIPAPEEGTPEARFGFFDDSYAYGEDEGDDFPDDWGSLSEGIWWPAGTLGDSDEFDRGKLLTWIRSQNNLFGGEAQGDETLWNTFPYVAWEASYAQTVYLNADYEDQVHDRWGEFIYTQENMAREMTNSCDGPYAVKYAIFDPVYDQKTGAEYFRDRLGYRLVQREGYASEAVRKGENFSFRGKIQNVGFGNIVNRKAVTVILEGEDGSIYSAPAAVDVRSWRPDTDSRAENTSAWRDLSFDIPIEEFGNVLPGNYRVYLKICDPKETSANKRCIRFANKGADIWNEELGANLIAETIVR